MSGKKEKQFRRTQGTSIAARRDMHAFERTVASTVEARAARVIDQRNMRRVALAWVALAGIAAAIMAGLFL